MKYSSMHVVSARYLDGTVRIAPATAAAVALACRPGYRERASPTPRPIFWAA